MCLNGHHKSDFGRFLGQEEGVGGRFYKRSGSISGDTNSQASIWKWVVSKWQHTAQHDNGCYQHEQDLPGLQA